MNITLSETPKTGFVAARPIVWCMKLKKALNKEKNTPIIRKDENGLKLKVIITSFNIRLLTLRKSVAS